MKAIFSTLATSFIFLVACSGGGGSSPAPVETPVGGSGSGGSGTGTGGTGGTGGRVTGQAPFVIVATGGANMLGMNEDGSGAFVTDSDVQVFANGDFVTSQTDVAPYGTTQAATQNLAHWFGQRVHEETGAPVRILFHGREDSLIEWWLDGTTPEGTNIRSVHENIIDQGFQNSDLADHDLTKVDVFLFHQGERNWDLEIYPSAQYYRPTLLNVFDAYRQNDWMDDTTPILVGDLAEAGQPKGGQSGTSANQNAVLSAFNGQDNIWTVDLSDLATDSSRQNFTGSSLESAGYDRYWDAWEQANDPNGGATAGDGDGGDTGDGDGGDTGDGDGGDTGDGDGGDTGDGDGGDTGDGDGGDTGDGDGGDTGDGDGGDTGDGDGGATGAGHQNHGNIINIPAPFSTISRSFDRKAINVSEVSREGKRAKNLNSAFRVRCGVARTIPVDPVLNRGPNDAMSHMHTYFGADVEIDKTTENADLKVSGSGSTCSGGRLNRSAYWMPTMLRSLGNGNYEPIMPTSYHAYYKTSLNIFGKHEDVLFQQNSGIPHETLIRRALPAKIPREWFNLRMIAHTLGPNDTVERRNSAKWVCTSRSGGEISSRDGIPDCGAGRLFLQFWFPQCLNIKKQPKGAALNDPGNYTRTGQDKWLRYAVNRTEPNGCPKNDSQNEWVRIPALSFSLSYDVGNEGTRDWLLSSDIMAGDVRPGSTIHGDFMNGWDEQTADDWYQSCLLDVQTCTSFFKNVGGNRWRKLIGSKADLFTNSTGTDDDPDE